MEVFPGGFSVQSLSKKRTEIFLWPRVIACKLQFLVDARALPWGCCHGVFFFFESWPPIFSRKKTLGGVGWKLTSSNMAALHHDHYSFYHYQLPKHHYISLRCILSMIDIPWNKKHWSPWSNRHHPHIMTYLTIFPRSVSMYLLPRQGLSIERLASCRNQTSSQRSLKLFCKTAMKFHLFDGNSKNHSPAKTTHSP